MGDLYSAVHRKTPEQELAAYDPKSGFAPPIDIPRPIKCATCGANIKPNTFMMRCEYCGTCHERPNI